MKKRVACFLLSALMVLSLIPAVAFGVSAASDLSISEEGIALIKEFEGFVSKPYYDYGQYSVGYGTACPDDKKDEYLANGISEKEADKLLREYLEKDEKRLNTFADKFGLVLTQYQFDALMSFTYNLGPDWMNNDSTFRSAVTDGASGNNFIFAITQWCNAGNEIKESLVNRRLAEANLYLNGVYSKTAPAKYDYVLFDDNGGTSTVKIQGYNSTVTDHIRAVPTQTGYRFMGWYTAKAGGKCITTLDASVAGTTLYARWQKDEGAVDQDGNILGTPANYEISASALVTAVVRDVPKISGNAIGEMGPEITLTITAEYVDANNVKWGKIDEGWINLSLANSGAVEEPETVIAKITVTSSYVNIRAGAGASTAFVRRALKGEQMEITQVRQEGNAKWGKFSEGWVCLSYTNYETALLESSPEASVVTAKGVVTTDGLRIRAGTSTSTAIMGTLNKGDEVEITLQKTVGVMHWGKIEQGWICLDYVNLTPVEPGESTDKEETTDKDETADKDETTGKDESADKDETAEDGKTEDNETTKPTVIATGTVYNCNTLRVRAGAGTKYAQTGSLANGTKVEILEQTVVNGQPWGRITEGWISLNYVKLDTSKEEQENALACVVLVNGLNVRSGPGTSNAKVATLNKDTEVLLMEIVQVGKSYWGRIEQGWVHLDYLGLIVEDGEDTTTPETPDKDESGDQEGTSEEKVISTGVIYRCDSLRIRAGAGTHTQHVGNVARGTRVEIYETTEVRGTTWGRTADGWISLYYVQLDATVVVPDQDISTDKDNTTDTDKDTTTGGDTSTGTATPTVIATGTIYRCTSLRVREYAGTNTKHIGDLPSGTRVNIYETVTVRGGNWARVDQGWISLYYVKLDATVTGPENGGTTTDTPTTGGDTATGTVLGTGTIYRTTSLRVREYAGTNTKHIGDLAGGTKVNIYETAHVRGGDWARIDQGWISLYYVKLDAPLAEPEVPSTEPEQTPSTGTEPEKDTTAEPDKDTTTEPGEDTSADTDKDTTTGTDTEKEPAADGSTGTTTESGTLEITLTGTIVNTDSVTVRSAAGVKNENVGSLKRGDRIQILELTTIPGGAMWGRISSGWVHMYYVELDETNDSIKVVNTDNLRIREAAGTKNTQVGTYTRGTMIIILETTTEGGTTWGRTDKGWVCMDYVK